ncbi:MAG: acyl carrier protein [Desulfobacterales bacterium CG07_land_8_20_14_0_80_52_14]|nr:MAG: acyl carrier protein [Desulfobacterales bacterium CG23_combo_of_CG06-09_8_20_14_all_52_9]PIU49158.1 MAG: acyl carrier protein [Desulfobacterales bacterium CG07_land_8_20_14_0_80_52_14]
MTDPEIVEKINASLSEEFELELTSMVPEASLFDDLELDSLDLVDMVIVLEQAFGFKIREEEEIRSIRTLGDIHAFVIRKKHQIRQNL